MSERPSSPLLPVSTKSSSLTTETTPSSPINEKRQHDVPVHHPASFSSDGDAIVDGSLVTKGRQQLVKRLKKVSSRSNFPVTIVFMICFIYLSLALAGVGYIPPFPRRASTAQEPDLHLPPSWYSDNPSPAQASQRSRAYAQAIGLMKGQSSAEIRKLWGGKGKSA